MFEEKGNTRKWNGAKPCTNGDKQIMKQNKGSGDLKASLHPVKLPNCSNKLRRSLELRVVVHTFNPTIIRQRQTDL